MINLKALALLEKNLPVGSTFRVVRYRPKAVVTCFTPLTREDLARSVWWPPEPMSACEVLLGYGRDEAGEEIAVFLKDLRVWGPSSPPLTKGGLEKHRPKPCSIGATS